MARKHEPCPYCRRLIARGPKDYWWKRHLEAERQKLNQQQIKERKKRVAREFRKLTADQMETLLALAEQVKEAKK